MFVHSTYEQEKLHKDGMSRENQNFYKRAQGMIKW